MEDMVLEDEEEDDFLGLSSDTVVSDDFFEGLEGLTGMNSGDYFSEHHFPASLWMSNNATTAASGI